MAPTRVPLPFPGGLAPAQTPSSAPQRFPPPVRRTRSGKPGPTLGLVPSAPPAESSRGFLPPVSRPATEKHSRRQLQQLLKTSNRGHTKKREHCRRSGGHVLFLARRRGGLLASGLVLETVGMRSPTSCSRIAEGITKRLAAKRSGKLLTIGSGTMRIVRFFSLRFVGFMEQARAGALPFPGGSVDVRHAGVCEGHRGRSTVLCGAGALWWWWGGNFGCRCPRQKNGIWCGVQRGTARAPSQNGKKVVRQQRANPPPRTRLHSGLSLRLASLSFPVGENNNPRVVGGVSSLVTSCVVYITF